MPPPLRPGDKVRFLSPASPPARDAVHWQAARLESWGLHVDFGEHTFRQKDYFAGSDEERLSDLNATLRDPDIRAIFATRGGRGCYRIADGLDFAAARRDPKFLVGFSDITILHLNLWKRCRLIGIHGALFAGLGRGFADVSPETEASLRAALMTAGDWVICARSGEPTLALTTEGVASGRLIGGNLDSISVAAGWALPDMRGGILLLEEIDMPRGQVDRKMTMLRKAGHLDGLAGVVVGQFTGFDRGHRYSVIDILREHLDVIGVPVLGGVPLGHGDSPLTVPIGAHAILDADAGTLTIKRNGPPP